MRITVDIDDSKMTRVMRATGKRHKSPAIRAAIDVYLREDAKRKVMRDILKGAFDYPLTNEELEA